MSLQRWRDQMLGVLVYFANRRQEDDCKVAPSKRKSVDDFMPPGWKKAKPEKQTPEQRNAILRSMVKKKPKK